MKPPTSILLIEDDTSLATGLKRVLTGEGHSVEVVSRGDDGLARACAGAFDVVITDLRMPGLSGLDLVRELHAARPRLPILLITAHGTTETAIEATKSGAYDYLLKPFEMAEFLRLIDQALESSRLMTEKVDLGTPGAAGVAIIGNSRVMQGIYKEIGRVAAKPVSVLIRGETGTGKELIARAVYQHSARANGPFVAINCGAIPEALLESELFGHERGAFTGAEARRIGRFEQAHGGTIFLDEIGDLSPGTQVKLLRVLQEKTIQRLGGRETIPVDVRVIAATHKNLESAMLEKDFREDLFYRLNVFMITLPPLRERREDIPDLVKYFLHKYGTEMGFIEPSISVEAIALLQQSAWPGNVRELENAVRKVLLLARNYTIRPEHVRSALNQPVSFTCSPDRPLGDYVEELLAAAGNDEINDAHARLMDVVEREIFTRAARRTQGNQAQMSRWLGLSRVTIREKLLHFGLHPKQSNESL